MQKAPPTSTSRVFVPSHFSTKHASTMHHHAETPHPCRCPNRSTRHTIPPISRQRIARVLAALTLRSATKHSLSNSNARAHSTTSNLLSTSLPVDLRVQRKLDKMSSVDVRTIGYPRIGVQRTLKKSLEAFWKDKETAEQLVSSTIFC